MKLDNLHYNWRTLAGYQKAFNIALSPRELGKSAMMWFTMIYRPFLKDHRPWVYFVRKTVEITEALIDSIFDSIIYKFDEDHRYEYIYNKGSFKDGLVDVYLIINEEKYLFFRIVSISIDLRRIKLAVLKDIKGAFFDEYIIDPRSGESYQKNEAFKLKEAYTTWVRECSSHLKFYFACNPYSLFCPLFVELGISSNLIKSGNIISGDLFVLDYAKVSPELKSMILAKNPLYVFDEDYNQYALEGVSINDRNIRLSKMPQNYYLRFVIRIANKILGIFQNQLPDKKRATFFVKFLNEHSSRRTAFTFDFNEMMEGTYLMSRTDRFKFDYFQKCFRRNDILFEEISCYYLTVEIYKNL